jgi:hypothetical protein
LDRVLVQLGRVVVVGVGAAPAVAIEVGCPAREGSIQVALNRRRGKRVLR